MRDTSAAEPVDPSQPRPRQRRRRPLCCTLTGVRALLVARRSIHIEGMELGYKNPVLFERHAIGGEYGAGYKSVGKGSMTTVFR